MAGPLFGDRARFGQAIDASDPDWIAWTALRRRFYEDTQRSGIGVPVTNAAYAVLRHVDVSGRRILEIGPGALPHLPFLRGTPSVYTIVDRNPDMIELARQRLASVRFPADVRTSIPSPGEIEPVDIVISFYSLEHLHPIDDYLERMCALLKQGGLLVGGIPAEGGLAWGLGRYLSTRRYIKRHSTANPDKILCWEHPNVAEAVLTSLDRHMRRRLLEYWPLRLPVLDLTLVARFIYERR